MFVYIGVYRTVTEHLPRLILGKPCPSPEPFNFLFIFWKLVLADFKPEK